MPEIELKTLHLTTPFRIAHGASSTRQVVRVKEGESTSEAPFVPYYHEDVDLTLEWLRLPQGEPPTHAAALAMDLLRCDQECRARGVALSSLAPAHLPQKTGPIPACRSFSIPTDFVDFAELVRDTARQFRILKLKLGSGDLDHDRQIISTARASAPQARIIADVNGGWCVQDSVRMLADLTAHRLELVEQPFHHQLGVEAWQKFHQLRQTSPHAKAIQVFADESAQTAQDVPRLAPYVDGVNVKLLKCASFGGALRMIETARQHGLGILLGCMIESSLGITAAAHLAPWADIADLDGHLYLSDDDFAGVTFDTEGFLHMPEGPGIGAIPR
ncbi:MAG: enolase C-terminal domain-like protein [Verrucomicrobiota bacterium]